LLLREAIVISIPKLPLNSAPNNALKEHICYPHEQLLFMTTVMQKINAVKLGDISCNFITVLRRTLRSLQQDDVDFLDTYQLTQQFIDTPDARISIPKYMRMGFEAIRLSQRSDFGLLMGKYTHVSDFGLPGFAAMSAKNLQEALHFLIDMETLSSHNSRGHSRFYLDKSRAICQFYSISPYNNFNYFVVDSTLSSWFELIRIFSQQDNLLHHVEIEFDKPRYAQQYEERFKCPVLFGSARNALVLKRGIEALPTIHSNVASFKQLQRLCQREKAALNQGKSTADRAADLITTKLSGDAPSIEDIAKLMGMAGWTLRRRLRDEGWKFQNILDQTRKSLAISYVKDSAHNFTEIAFLLGFSSPTAFQRAFKRWTEISPGEYRRKNIRTFL
jgi:AraC-like DNA-binding protein